MELRPGYKLSAAGVIPENWGAEAVGDAFEIRNQLRLPLSQAVRERMSGPYPYFGPTSAQGSINEYRIEGEHALIGEDGDHFLKWRTHPMTLLVDGRFNVNNHAHVVKGTKNLTAWFYWYFVNRDICDCLTRQGASRYKLTKAALQQLPCAIPPREEQVAIITVLSDIEALRSGLDHLIAKKRDLKQAAMQQLLTGQTRLPGFQGEWEVKRLGEICEIGMGRTPSRLNSAFWGRGYVWLSIADLQSKVISQSKEQITDIAASTMTIVPRGTLLMSFKLSIGRLCFAGCDLFTNEAICSFNQPKADTDYLYYALSRTDFSLYGKQAVKGYTLNKESLKLVEVRLPPRMEQAAIAAVLSDMDAELAALEARRDKTRALKQGMMQELLTGRTRLV